MTIKRRQQGLMGLGALLGIGAIVLLLWGFLTPVELAASLTKAAAANTAGIPAARPSTAREPLDLEELRRLSARDWRHVLDARSVEEGLTAEGGTSGASLTVQLIGTVREANTAAALLQKPDGTIIVCTQGQSFAEAAGTAWVVRVEDRRVWVRYGGGVTELTIPGGATTSEHNTP